MKHAYLYLLLLVLLGCKNSTNNTTASDAKNSEISLLFDQIEVYLSSPQDSLYKGFHPVGKWDSYSQKSQLAQKDSIIIYVDKLESIADLSLNEQEVISKKVMLIRLKDILANIDFRMYLIPFNAEGGFYNEMAFVLPNLPFNKIEDYQNYLKWLPQYNNYLNENITALQIGLKEGIVAPKIIVKNNLALLEPWLDLQNTVMYEPIKDSENDVLKKNQKVKAEIELQLIQITMTLNNLKEFLENDYMNAAFDNPGISFIPGGEQYYENRIQHYSTLTLSPDSVHNLGLSEVRRIRTAMDDIILKLGYKGSFDQFLQFLRTDKQFFPDTPQELLNYASWLSKKAEGQLPKYFNKLYSLPFTVEPVPASIAPTYTTGRYVDGSFESKRPGIYWVNTYNLPSRTLYTLPALTLHEAVPGHHLQNAIASELKDIPSFRNTYYISAFGEGWGLYSEFLGEEMGMYETPYELFGRYTYEMWRACRLVVDTGIHYKGWTRQEALDYMAGNTALSMHEVTTEIDRYIGWPGQALSYKIGEIKIKSLRKKSEEALGEKFDIREFHNVILRNGSVPLEVLEEQVNNYIDQISSTL